MRKQKIPEAPKAPRSPEEIAFDKKVTSTTFLQLFPCLIIAVIAVVSASIGLGMIAIGLFIYQFILLKKLVEDYYRTRPILMK